MCAKDAMFCVLLMCCVLNKLSVMDASTILRWEEWLLSMHLDVTLDPQTNFGFLHKYDFYHVFKQERITTLHHMTARTGHYIFPLGMLQDISSVRRLLMQKCSMHSIEI